MKQTPKARLRRRLRSAFLAVQPRVIPASWLTYRMRAEGRTAALTFDDGPDPRSSPALWDALERLDCPATLFYLGRQAEQHPQLVREACSRGHQVSNHGYDHTVQVSDGWRAYRDNVLRGEAAIGGAEPAADAFWFRPPRGVFPRRLLVWAALRNRTIAKWSLDSGDWSGDAAAVLERTHPDCVRPGDVILMHEDNAETLRILPEIVGRLRDAGYSFVTMRARPVAPSPDARPRSTNGPSHR